MEKKELSLGVTIIAFNEENRIEECLKSLHFANEIVVVVDDRTTDKTEEICRAMGAKVIREKFVNYGHQKNLALSMATSEWILSIDADERVSPKLKESIINFLGRPTSCGAIVNRKSFYLNRWILHGGWYPDYILRLFRRTEGSFTEPQVHEELVVPGKHPILEGDLIHYPFESLRHQIVKNLRYAEEGAKNLEAKGKKFSFLFLILKTLSKFLECYVWKLGFLDGLAGFVIAVNAAHSVFLKWCFLKYEIQRTNY